MRSFDFTSVNENAVPLIHSKKFDLHFSASEMLNVCYCLSFIIGDLIPRNNKYWRLYVALREILTIVMKPVLTIEMTYYLENCIVNTLELYLNLSGLRLTPKMHFMLHYPYMTRKIGPAVKV